LFVPALSIATAARATTSLALYFLGAQMSEKRLRRFVKRRFERPKLSFRSDLGKASEVFERHGGKAILLSPLVPGVGAWISVPADLKRMPIRWRFTGYRLLGNSLWVGSFIVLGWALWNQWEIVGWYASIAGYAVLTAVVVEILWLLWRSWRTQD
jgi:membrane protein DedA with SNARE-associated domain